MWTFEFEKAQDIISILKFQLSYLFKEALKIKAKYERTVPDYFQLNISNEALRILIDKPRDFEFQFFVQTLVDEINKKKDLNNDYKYKIHYNPKSFIYEISDFPRWVMDRLATIENLMLSLSNLFEQAYPELYNEPGKPSDLYGLYYISRTYAQIYEHLINWSIDTRSVHVPENCVELRDKLSNLAKAIIKKTWNYPSEVKEKLEEVKLAILNNGEPPKVEMILKLSFGDEAQELYKEVQQFNEKLRITT